MNRKIRGMLVACLVTMVGCGTTAPIEKVTPVSGSVKLDGKPADHVRIIFIPTSNTSGRGGSAVTGGDGAFEVENANTQLGLAPGTYQISFSRRLQPDGTLPVDDDAMTVVAAVETLDPRSNLDPTSRSPEPLIVTISEGGTSGLNFEVFPKK